MTQDYQSFAKEILTALASYPTLKVNHKYLPDVLALASQRKIRLVYTGSYYTEVALARVLTP